jgi:hypothetical protein
VLFISPLELFGSIEWSPSGKQFMYVAEKKRIEQRGFEKFVHVEYFGEKLFLINDPVICVLNLEIFSVNVLNLDVPQNIFPSQPVFANEDTIFFNGIEVGSKKLGMTYIYSRNTSIYRANFGAVSIKTGTMLMLF